MLVDKRVGKHGAERSGVAERDCGGRWRAGEREREGGAAYNCPRAEQRTLYHAYFAKQRHCCSLHSARLVTDILCSVRISLNTVKK